MARRKRCQGSCGNLFQPDELVPVAGMGYVCQSCLLDAADAVAVEQGVLEEGDTLGTTPDEAGRTLIDLAEAQSTDPRPALAARPNKFSGLPDADAKGWPLKYGRISASALATFARCPEQFRLGSIIGIKRPQGGAPLTGSAVHEALETQWAYRIQHGIDATADEVRQAYHASFEHQVGKANDEVEWSGRSGPRQTKDDWRSAGEAVAVEYHRTMARTVEPVAYEDMFSLVLPGVPVPVIGYLDLVTTENIIDEKVGGKAHKEIASDWMMQGLIYQLSPYRLPMRWHSAAWPTKGGDVALSVVDMPLTADSYRVGVMIVRKYVRAILAYTAAFGVDEPWPGAVNHSWACKSCEYRTMGQCQWWQPRMDDLADLLA